MADIQFLIPDHFQPALAKLLMSFDYANDCGAEVWQFAIDLPELISSGASVSDLRWLIYRGFGAHGKETTSPGDPSRSFRPLSLTCFPSDACVVLTSEGAKTIRSLQRPIASARASHLQMSRESGRGRIWSDCMLPPTYDLDRGETFGGDIKDEKTKSTDIPDATSAGTSNVRLPRFDAKLHELRLGDEIVKRFIRPAPAQELILAVFQEEGWPPAIDDPLTSPNQDPKRHLHYTIRNLNRGQDPLRIRFYINGNGETIRWVIMPQQSETSAHCARG